MAAPEDEEVIKRLAARCPHPPLRKRVRPRGPVRQLDHAHTLAAEDIIEAGGELGVTVAELEAGLELTLEQLPGQGSGLLRNPLSGRVPGTAGEMDAAASDLEENST